LRVLNSCVQLNTERQIPVNDGLAHQVEAAVESALSRFGDQITRVGVHLSDVNRRRMMTTNAVC
jgi:hypothetical protein